MGGVAGPGPGCPCPAFSLCEAVDPYGFSVSPVMQSPSSPIIPPTQGASQALSHDPTCAATPSGLANLFSDTGRYAGAAELGASTALRMGTARAEAARSAYELYDTGGWVMLGAGEVVQVFNESRQIGFAAALRGSAVRVGSTLGFGASIALGASAIGAGAGSVVEPGGGTGVGAVIGGDEGFILGSMAWEASGQANKAGLAAERAYLLSHGCHPNA